VFPNPDVGASTIANSFLNSSQISVYRFSIKSLLFSRSYLPAKQSLFSLESIDFQTTGPRRRQRPSTVHLLTRSPLVARALETRNTETLTLRPG
jgi:hypothetical protein